MSRTRLAILAYAAMGFVTFGHSAAAAQREDDAQYAACHKQSAVCWHNKEMAPIGGFLAGMFWPLYWSWEIWS